MPFDRISRSDTSPQLRIDRGRSLVGASVDVFAVSGVLHQS